MRTADEIKKCPDCSSGYWKGEYHSCGYHKGICYICQKKEIILEKAEICEDCFCLSAEKQLEKLLLTC